MNLQGGIFLRWFRLNMFYFMFRFMLSKQIKDQGMFKKQGTPLSMFSSDNIYGTQTSLTQLSAVKAASSEKRGKIQTTKMTKFGHLVNKKGT